jgi:hypothetical protein
MRKMVAATLLVVLAVPATAGGFVGSGVVSNLIEKCGPAMELDFVFPVLLRDIGRKIVRVIRAS